MANARSFYAQKATQYGISTARLKSILALVGACRGKRVLDVGCSTGYLGGRLVKRGAWVTGIDISVAAIQRARRVLHDARVVDVEQKLPFRGGTFDIVIAAEILEHLFDPTRLIRECHRVLKPRGTLIISTPNFLYWGNRLQFLLGRFQYADDGICDRGHIHFYTYRRLYDDFHDAGFSVLKENHVYAGELPFSWMTHFRPSLFAYQFVLKCQK